MRSRLVPGLAMLSRLAVTFAGLAQDPALLHDDVAALLLGVSEQLLWLSSTQISIDFFAHVQTSIRILAKMSITTGNQILKEVTIIDILFHP